MAIGRGSGGNKIVMCNWVQVKDMSKGGDVPIIPGAGGGPMPPLTLSAHNTHGSVYLSLHVAAPPSVTQLSEWDTTENGRNEIIV